MNKLRFGKYTVACFVTFVAGIMYGAVWEHCLMTDEPKATTPATVEDFARIRADMARPAPPAAKRETNSNPAAHS